MSTAGVTVNEVIEAVRLRRALMAPETAGYLVLAAADQLTVALARVDGQTCSLLVEGGGVQVSREPGVPEPVEVERALRRMLQRLLHAASGSAPALSAVAALAPKGNLAVLVAELESALIPVNRAAAARALSRLARETARVRAELGASLTRDTAHAPLVDGEADDTEPIAVPIRHQPGVAVSATQSDSAPPTAVSSGPLSAAPPSAGDDSPGPADHDVDELLAVRTPPPAPEQVPPVPDLELPSQLAGRLSRRVAAPAPPLAAAQTARSVHELLEGFMAVDPKHEARLADDLRQMAGVDDLVLSTVRGNDTPFESLGALELSHATPPPARATVPPRTGAHPTDLRAPGSPETPTSVAPAAPVGGPPRRAWVWLSLLVVLAGAGALFLWLHEPGWWSSRSPELVEAERRLQQALQSAVSERQACHATIVVADVPAAAEVLVYAGVAPVDVERVPASAGLEFVAMVDGYAPKRASIPAGIAWDTSSGKPRFELAVQLDRSRAKPAAIDPWPAAGAGTVVGGPGAAGTVHVVTTPAAAEVWMVVGGAPEARLEALPCGAAKELLVAGSTAGQPFRRRLHVDSGQTTPGASSTEIVAKVSAAN